MSLAGVALAGVAPLLGRLHWTVDNANSVALQLFGCVLAFTALALLQRRWKTALAAGLATLIQAAQVLPQLGSDGPPPPGPSVSWLVANVHAANRRHEKLISLVKEQQPDLVGLTEINQRWLDAIDGPLEDYRYRVVEPREDNFGIGLFSRIPLENAGLRDFGLTATIGATIEVGGRDVDLLLVHVVPPVTSSYVDARDAQLDAIGRVKRRQEVGLVVAGDFNVTPFSSVFRESFLEQGFHRAGALIGTWPAGLPSPLRVPIDHAVATKEVDVQSSVLRTIRSDHVPMLLRIGAGPPRPGLESR